MSHHPMFGCWVDDKTSYRQEVTTPVIKVIAVSDQQEGVGEPLHLDRSPSHRLGLE
jgi:hypothetical protein